MTSIAFKVCHCIWVTSKLKPIFLGDSPVAVQEQHRSHNSLFSLNLLSRKKKKTLSVHPFNATCIGIETATAYTVSLISIRFDLLKLLQLSIGIFVFTASGKLSRATACFYGFGVLLGNFASILVLIWFVSKLIPKVKWRWLIDDATSSDFCLQKSLAFGSIVAGWSLAAYFAQILLDNIQPIIISYQKFVLMYMLAASVISFGVCYYKGKWTEKICTISTSYPRNTPKAHRKMKSQRTSSNGLCRLQDL